MRRGYHGLNALRRRSIHRGAPQTKGTHVRKLIIIGSGPAGVYAAETLLRSAPVKSGELEVSIDLFERMPAPFGLIRYGVAPDHPRIKGIITALHRILGRGDIRFLGDVEFGTAEDCRRHQARSAA